MHNKQNQIDLHHLLTTTKGEASNYSPIVDLHNVNIRRTDDVYQHACNITAWQQLYDQLKPGHFAGQLDECWLDGIQFFKEYTSHAVHQSCMVWPKALWLGIPPSNEEIDGYIGSQAISQQSIALRGGGKEFELNTPDDYTIMGLVVDLELLMDHIHHLYPEQQEQLITLLGHTTLEVNPYYKQQVCQLIQQALLAGGVNPQLTANPATITTLRQELLDNLVHLLLATRRIELRHSHTRVHYQQLVKKAHDYVLGHPQDVITVASLCQHLHVSRRTLQNCFQTVWGISPNSYLKAIRLNAVRRELKSRYSTHQSVQDAAMAWGFWHLSQFAVDYQSLFGELPSQTLAGRNKTYCY